ncbi:hypothetical protein ACFORG_16620 [Lutimaribacter marinistellae]|uniref:Uncharacterized protein n=1 Tax=Lutimaribacter marinistellae TaxID=1820329 RepID=A0ABV7TID6_9RHOB
MTLSFIHRRGRIRRRIPRGIPRDLPPHLMRDIGSDPWPDRLPKPTAALW